MYILSLRHEREIVNERTSTQIELLVCSMYNSKASMIEKLFKILFGDFTLIIKNNQQK